MTRFHALYGHDLEMLVADLLGADEGARYEVFARGPDGGIDLRRRDEQNKLRIVQVKHFERSSFSQLETEAKKEKAKVDVLEPKPDHYRFVTSQPLTVAGKNKLVEALKPYATDPGRIIGGDELERLLEAHPEVERRHPKLWLTGSVQLAEMVHADVRNRSRELLASIEEDIPRYVRHEGFDSVRQRLHEGRVLVIAGDAGLGKTTLAHLLVADALWNEDYDEVIEVRRNVSEAWAVFDEQRRQIIVYDDFLGRAALDRLDKNEDRSLVSLMRAVIRAPHSLFILTTRGYILNHAAQLHRELQHGNVEERRYVLRLGEYSLLDRARIFVNHAYASGALTPAAREALLEGDAYLRILEHSNYNPRSVAYVTGMAGPALNDDQIAEYVAFVESVFDDPARLWREAFRQELGDRERALLLALVTGPDRIEHDDLRRMFDGIATELGTEAGEEPFDEALRSLDDSMIRTFQEVGHVFIAPRDPSVTDYLAVHLRGSPEHLGACLRGAVALEQVTWLVRAGVGSESHPATPSDTAAAVKRTYESQSITWHEVLWDNEPFLTRQDRDRADRLLRLHDLMQGSSELEAALAPWWQEALAALVGHLGEESRTRGGVLRLVRTVRDQLLEVPGSTQALELYFARGLTYPMAWEELLEFREQWPQAYSAARWAQLAHACEEWAWSQLGDPEEIQDIEEVSEIVSVAERFGADLPRQLVEHAESSVESSRYDEYEPPDDWEPHGDPDSVDPPSEEEISEARELFARLANDDPSEEGPEA